MRRFQEYSQPLEAENKLTLGSLVVDLDLRDALVEGRRAQLTAREFELLVLLARSPGRALARDWIFEEIWGCDAELGVKVLAVCVRRIRCKIETNPDEPRYLQTVRGFGYKLITGTE